MSEELLIALLTVAASLLGVIAAYHAIQCVGRSECAVSTVV